MKNLGYALLFIFCSICTIIGLCISKFYNNYIKQNIFIQVLLYLIGFLLILKLALVIIIPLVVSMFGNIDIGSFNNIFNTYILPIVKTPLSMMVFLIAFFTYLIKKEN